MFLVVVEVEIQFHNLFHNLLHRFSGGGDPVPQPTPQPISQPTPCLFTPIIIKLDDLPCDPSDRPVIYSYDPNIVKEIRDHGAGDAFTVHRFDSWSKKTSLKDHVGKLNSFHNKTLQKCENLIKKKQSISLAFNKQTEQETSDYRILLYLSIKTCRFLLKGRCPFRGHDETISSLNRGIFLELYYLLANEDEETRMVVARAPLNCTLTSPKIQKPICEYFAKEVLDSILEDIGDNVFSLLVDESIVVSKKEQMEMVFQYLNRHGVVQERFVGRNDMVRDNYKQRIELELNEGVTESGKGKDQKLSLMRPEALDGRNRNQATGILSYFKKFEFAFYCHLMEHILGITDLSSTSLKKRDQNIVEAVSMIKGTKQALMDEIYVAKRNRVAGIKNRQYFGIDIFNTDLDMQIQEFGDRFDDFTDANSFSLRRELDLYYETVIHDTYFMKFTGIVELATLMVTRKKHISFPLIYKLLMLSLLLHVATATVERCFSAMKLIKTNLHNRMGENYRNDALIWKIEKELFAKVTNEDVMKRFQGSKRRRGQ
ncbi:zinc finger MYM-type protein 1-like protein [Tanacetum coccineum]